MSFPTLCSSPLFANVLGGMGFVLGLTVLMSYRWAVQKLKQAMSTYRADGDNFAIWCDGQTMLEIRTFSHQKK